AQRALRRRRLGGARAPSVRRPLRRAAPRGRVRGDRRRDARRFPRRRGAGHLRPDRTDVDDGRDHQGAGGGFAGRRPCRCRPRRLARRDGRRLPRQPQLPVRGRRPVGRPPRRHHRLRGRDHRAGPPDRRRPRPLRDALRAVLHARRPRQRGPGDHHLRRPVPPLDRGYRDARRLDPPLRCRQGLLLLPRPPPLRLRRARGARGRAAGAAVGEPRSRGVEESRRSGRRGGSGGGAM
ncbi:MAG: Mll2313 protein, partial [uncultured Thermomicrobiales bacterium]